MSEYDYSPISTRLTVKRVNLLTSEMSSGDVVDTAMQIAKNIYKEARKDGYHYAFGSCARIPLWRILDPVNAARGNGVGGAYRRLDCYSGKILAAIGLRMLGVEQDVLRTRNDTDGCCAYTSTDIINGATYYSDCTHWEYPAEMCSDDQCDYNVTYGTSHPQHCSSSTAGNTCTGTAEPRSGGWVVGFAGNSPCENFLKVQADTGRWYYLSVCPACGPYPGSETLGDTEDMYGRYWIMWASQRKAPVYVQVRGYNVPLYYKQWWINILNGDIAFRDPSIPVSASDPTLGLYCTTDLPH